MTRLGHQMSARGVNTANRLTKTGDVVTALHLTGVGVDVTALHLTGAGVVETALHLTGAGVDVTALPLTGTGVDVTADLQMLDGEVAVDHLTIADMIRKTVTVDVTGIVTISAVMTAGVTIKTVKTVGGQVLKRVIVRLLKKGSAS